MTNIFVLFIVGFVLGCTIVMLLWMASPGCLLSQSSGGEGATAGTSANLTYPGGTYTNMVIRDASGARTLATTGDRGTPSTFTDENGRTRNVLCYMSYYCVDETPCEEEECVQLSQRCGEWPSGTGTLAAATNMQGGTTNYGDCCDPYQCVNGYCSQEECVPEGRKCSTDRDCCEGQCLNGVCGQQGCQQENDLCGYVYPTQTATTAYANQQPTYYGECCEQFECVNNRCTPQEGCVNTGKTCGRVQDTSVVTAVVYKDYGDCCPPDECVNNVCGGEEQCVQTGQTCGTTYPVGATANYPIEHGECCPPDECVNNVCVGEEPCIQTGGMCGYGPATSATYTNVANRPWYGDCCQGDTCVDGYCQPQCAQLQSKCSSTLACCEGYCVSGVCATCEPAGYTCRKDSECCQGYSCQNGKCSSCMKEYSECSKDSDCCNGLMCMDGTCRSEGQCGEQGDTCGLQVECCDGFTCSDNDVCVACAEEGSTCGGQYTTGAGGMPCCDGSYCYSGRCKAQTGYLCEDTENGPGYYEEGTATGEYQGSYGSYTDYCGATANFLYEYYCDAPGEYSEVLLASVTCPQGCSGGACK